MNKKLFLFFVIFPLTFISGGYCEDAPRGDRVPKGKSKDVLNEVSCKDPIGAESFKKVEPTLDFVKYVTKPKDGDRLSSKPSHVEKRRDLRVLWVLGKPDPSETQHTWYGMFPPGKRVWVQITGELICKKTATGGGAGGGGGTGAGGTTAGPEWQSWSVDIDLDGDANFNGIIDPSPTVPDDNLISEDILEETNPGVTLCNISPLILRKIKPDLPGNSTGEVVIERSESDKVDIRTNPNDPSTSIFSGAGAKKSLNFFNQVRTSDVNLWLVPLKKGDFNLDAKLRADVVFPARVEEVKFEDRVRVTVEEDGITNLEMENVPETEEENPGGYILVNANNNNGSPWVANTNNHIPTRRDFSVITPLSVDDPELVKFDVISPSNLRGGILRLTVEEEGRARIRVWSTRRKDRLLTLPLNDPPSTFFVEGIREGEDERDIRLTLELVRDGDVICDDVVVISVTPILLNLEVGLRSEDGPIFTAGHLLQSNRGLIAATSFEATAIVSAEGLLFSQTADLENMLNNGTASAILHNGNTRTYGWPGGAPRQDSRNNIAVPIYESRPENRFENNRESIFDRDSPALELNSRVEGNVLPPPGNSTTIDNLHSFILHAGYRFSDGSIYFLGRTTWSIRFAGVISAPANIFRPRTFTPSNNNRNTGSSGFLRTNDNPTPVTIPFANEMGNPNGSAWRP